MKAMCSGCVSAIATWGGVSITVNMFSMKVNVTLGIFNTFVNAQITRSPISPVNDPLLKMAVLVLAAGLKSKMTNNPPVFCPSHFWTTAFCIKYGHYFTLS